MKRFGLYHSENEDENKQEENGSGSGCGCGGCGCDGGGRKENRLKPKSAWGWIWRSSILLLIFYVATSCSQAPKEIQMGREECAHCKMKVTNKKFVSQAQNPQGKTYVFDSIECLAAFETTTAGKWEEAGRFWVPDFTQPESSERWIKASEADIVKSASIRSPMGLALLAFDNREAAEKNIDQYGGKILSFEKTVELVAEEWELGSDSKTSKHTHQLNEADLCKVN